MKCEHCDNEARYTNAAGERLCGLCDMKSGNPSVRDIDLPFLLVLVDGLVEALEKGWLTDRMMKDIKPLIGRISRG